jgi:hypothetical protein
MKANCSDSEFCCVEDTLEWGRGRRRRAVKFKSEGVLLVSITVYVQCFEELEANATYLVIQRMPKI